jgi:hypothetical protein
MYRVVENRSQEKNASHFLFLVRMWAEQTRMEAKNSIVFPKNNIAKTKTLDVMR